MQKSYKTETLPKLQKRNRGERDMYYAENTHNAIISKQDFSRVQAMLSESVNKYHRETKGKHILGSMIRCGICGSAYKRKCNYGKYYWSYIEHDIDSSECSAKPIPEDSIKRAFISMCNKMILHYRYILLPLQRSLQELNSRRFCGNTKILDIHKGIADIKKNSGTL